MFAALKNAPQPHELHEPMVNFGSAPKARVERLVP
jgi:hypothetical protein